MDSVNEYISTNVHPYLPNRIQSIMSSYSLTPGLKGWHERALSTPHPEPEGFQPSYGDLVFVALSNTQVVHEGFSVALFKQDKQNVAVDGLGRVLLVSESDYAGLTTLAQKFTIDLPDSGNFRNTWVVKRPTTSQPIDRFLVKGAEDGKLKQTSVQGWSESTRELKEPIGEYTELPETLADFVGLIREATEGVQYGPGHTDPPMVRKVKEIVPDDF
ncbi:hypothetical protein AAF712_011368 [Marasmius tenuissimus]|uniref:Uncharacterized protein n=1 Tax=Marasmius tenuissimus TaxID=585030 RepID=A0ABR2ZKD0_9AGAR